MGRAMLSAARIEARAVLGSAEHFRRVSRKTLRRCRSTLNRSSRQQQHTTHLTTHHACARTTSITWNSTHIPRFASQAAGGPPPTAATKGEHHVGSILSAGNGCNATGRSTPPVQLCAQAALGSRRCGQAAGAGMADGDGRCAAARVWPFDRRHHHLAGFERRTHKYLNVPTAGIFTKLSHRLPKFWSTETAFAEAEESNGMTDRIGMALHRLGSRLPGRLSLPGDDGYAVATAIWAKSTRPAPRAIVHCLTTQDVQAAID